MNQKFPEVTGGAYGELGTVALQRVGVIDMAVANVAYVQNANVAPSVPGFAEVNLNVVA